MTTMIVEIWRTLDPFRKKIDVNRTLYGHKVPAKACFRQWPAQERNGGVVVYYDRHDREPDWESPEVDWENWCSI